MLVNQFAGLEFNTSEIVPLTGKKLKLSFVKAFAKLAR